MAYEPTLLSYMDSAPMPRAEVLFTSFAPTTSSITVYRLADRREYQLRGGVNAPAAGAFTRIDMEVPFGVPANYRAEMFNAAGLSLGFTGQTPVTMPVEDTWLHNPLNPAGGVKVAFRGNAVSQISRPVEGSVFYPQGRRVGVVIAGDRAGIRGVALDVITDTIEDADKVRDLLGDYSTSTVPALCFRIGASDRVRLPRPFFASVLDIQERDLTYAIGGTQIAHGMVGDEVSPPSPGLFVPLLTRADLNNYYATRSALNAGNLTRLAVNRRYDLAGSA